MTRATGRCLWRCWRRLARSLRQREIKLDKAAKAWLLAKER